MGKYKCGNVIWCGMLAKLMGAKHFQYVVCRVSKQQFIFYSNFHRNIIKNFTQPPVQRSSCPRSDCDLANGNGVSCEVSYFRMNVNPTCGRCSTLNPHLAPFLPYFPKHAIRFRPTRNSAAEFPLSFLLFLSPSSLSLIAES